MKIGIITFYNTEDNYGQVLQCFALQEFLRKNGHIPFLIRYNPATKPVSPPRSITKILMYVCKFRTYIRLYQSRRKTELYRRTAKNELRAFGKFRDDYIVSTNIDYTEEELITNPPQADAYICGSDQIWGGDYAYYLNFAPSTARRIAYAPSFGGIMSFKPEYEKQLKELLAKFSFLGLRENSGVDTCRRLGYEYAMKVVDPTLLLDTDDYNKLRITRQASKKYVFVYLLGNPTALHTKSIYKWAKEHKYEVRYVASQGQFDKYPKCYDTIGEWIDDIVNAEFIITNSFHCCVFSLLYGKAFIAVPLIGSYARMNTRIEELLAACDLQHRLYQGSIDAIVRSDMSFDGFTKYRQEKVQHSAALLLTALS